MKKILLSLLFAYTFTSCISQDADTMVSERSDFIISGSLSSGASLISLDLEKLNYLKSDRILAFGVGFGFNQEFQIFSSSDPTNYFMLPHHISYNLGNKRSLLELGVGATLVYSGSNNYYLVYPMLGYRYHPFRNPGFSFKAWLYFPFGQKFITEYNEILFSPLGLSFGIAL